MWQFKKKVSGLTNVEISLPERFIGPDTNNDYFLQRAYFHNPFDTCVVTVDEQCLEHKFWVIFFQNKIKHSYFFNYLLALEAQKEKSRKTMENNQILPTWTLSNQLGGTVEKEYLCIDIGHV